MRRPRFVSANCPHCGTLHERVPVDWSDEGDYYSGKPDLDTVPCGHDECTVKLCASCPQFRCDGCGEAHCLEHKVEFADLKLCPVCMHETEEQAAEIARETEDPPCDCVFSGDTADNRGCPAHGPHSETARRIRMQEAAAEAAYWEKVHV